MGGQATKLWKHYFDNVHGLIFVIDSADTDKIGRARSELSRVSRDAGLASVPYLLMFNKCDLVDQRMTLEQLIEKLDLEELSANRVINF